MNASWLAGAATVVACWYVGTVFSVAGRCRAAQLFAGDSPPFGATFRAQLTGTALNRVLPANGGVVASHARLLRREGLSAARPLLGYAASHLLAHVALGCAVVVLVVLDALPMNPRFSVPAELFLLLLVPLPVLLLPKVRRAVGATAKVCVERPGAVVGIALYEIATMLVLGVGLYVALQTTGSSLSLPLVMVVLVVSTVLAGAVPAPAGTGPVELALVGTLIAFGATSPVSGVAMYRLVTHWLPVPLGLLALYRGRLRLRRAAPLPA